MYRFANAARLIKQSLDEGWLGPLQSFSLESGIVYDWPVTSGFFAEQKQAGGGELIDIGSHMLDLLLWWLGEAGDLEYRDDSMGGTEGDCSLNLTLNNAAGPVAGTVLLSRLRQLADRVRIVGDRFTLEYDLSSTGAVTLHPANSHAGELSLAACFEPASQQTWEEVYAEQLGAFAKAIRGESEAGVSGRDALPSVALIERCYRERRPLSEPWRRTQPRTPHTPQHLKRVLVTGATGFIGGRVAEVACERGLDVVALVRRWPRAARLARLPVSMESGDVLNSDSLQAAMKGCDTVFHCVVDETVAGEAHRRAAVEGTENVLQTAKQAGVGRVVHLSSTAVYSYRPALDASGEEGAYHYSGDPYCDGKIDSEKAALAFASEHDSPEVVVLRPTYVYGPFGYYSEHTARAIRSRTISLINAGQDLCNCLYVDNLVEAMFLAAERDGVAGEVFHISDADPICWREFIEGHMNALGDNFPPLPTRTVDEIDAMRAKAAAAPPSSLRQTLALLRDDRAHTALVAIPVVNRAVKLTKALARPLLPESARRALRKLATREEVKPQRPGTAAQEPELPLPIQAEIDIYTSQVHFQIDKARRLLGYEPHIDFAEGMARTATWIQWARL